MHKMVKTYNMCDIMNLA